MSEKSLDNHVKQPAGGLGIQLLICCAIGLTCFLGVYMRIPVLPLFAAELGAGTTQIGLINAAFMLSAGLLAVPSGLLSDRIGNRPVLLAGLLLMSLASFLIPWSSGPLMLGVVYLLFGAGLSAVTPTMMSVVGRIAPRSHLGRAYSWYTTAVYISMTLGPAVGGVLAGIWGVKQLFFLSGSLIFLALLASVRFLPGTDVGGSGEQAAGIPTSLMKNRRLLAALAGTLGGCFGFGMFISFLPVYAHAQGFKPGQIGIIFASQAVVNTLLRIPLGHLCDKVERGVMSAVGLAVCAAALVLTGMNSTMLGLSVCAGFLGLGMGISFTALSAMTAAVLPQGQRGLGMGLYNSCIYLGMMLSSATMGTLIHETSFRTGFIVAGALTLVMTIAFTWLYRSGCRIPETGNTHDAAVPETITWNQEEAA